MAKARKPSTQKILDDIVRIHKNMDYLPARLLKEFPNGLPEVLMGLKGSEKVREQSVLELEETGIIIKQTVRHWYEDTDYNMPIWRLSPEIADTMLRIKMSESSCNQ